MVAMTMLCGTRIRYSRILVHPIGDVLAGGVEEGGVSSGRHFHGVVDLVQSTQWRTQEIIRGWAHL
jgi:hypothetical protein